MQPFLSGNGLFIKGSTLQSFIPTVKENNEEISATSKQQPEAQVDEERPKYSCPFCDKPYHYQKTLKDHMGAVHNGKKVHQMSFICQLDVNLMSDWCPVGFCQLSATLTLDIHIGITHKDKKFHKMSLICPQDVIYTSTRCPPD